MKVQTVGSVGDFLNGNKEVESFNGKVGRHFNKYGFYYRIAGVTLIALSVGSHALAYGAIDTEAGKLYKEIVNIGKWIIIFKGAIDIMRALGDGDTGSAKKTFITSILTFIILLGLPFGMEKVSVIFDKVTH